VVLSVPETTSRASCDRLRDAAVKELRKPVLVVTHNVEFLRATKLSTAEAARVIKQAETQTAAADAQAEAQAKSEEVTT